jgi:Leucine-rich repeat (LRR) protein
MKKYILIFFITIAISHIEAQEMVPSFSETTDKEIDEQLKYNAVSLYRINKIPDRVMAAKDLRSLIVLVSDSLKTIPAAIGEFKKLGFLSVANTDITVIPNEIGNLKELVELHLSINYVTKMPASIRELTKLKTLYLMSMYLEEVPKQIGELANLEKIDICEQRSLPPYTSSGETTHSRT